MKILLPGAAGASRSDTQTLERLPRGDLRLRLGHLPRAVELAPRVAPQVAHLVLRRLRAAPECFGDAAEAGVSRAEARLEASRLSRGGLPRVLGVAEARPDRRLGGLRRLAPRQRVRESDGALARFAPRPREFRLGGAQALGASPIRLPRLNQRRLGGVPLARRPRRRVLGGPLVRARLRALARRVGQFFVARNRRTRRVGEFFVALGAPRLRLPRRATRRGRRLRVRRRDRSRLRRLRVSLLDVAPRRLERRLERPRATLRLETLRLLRVERRAKRVRARLRRRRRLSRARRRLPRRLRRGAQLRDPSLRLARPLPRRVLTRLRLGVLSQTLLRALLRVAPLRLRRIRPTRRLAQLFLERRDRPGEPSGFSRRASGLGVRASLRLEPRPRGLHLGVPRGVAEAVDLEPELVGGARGDRRLLERELGGFLRRAQATRRRRVGFGNAGTTRPRIPRRSGGGGRRDELLRRG